MVTVDPVQEVAKLREHLASGDKLISFLFGAGTSAIKGSDGNALIPLVSGLTNECKTAVELLGAPYVAAWSTMVDSLPSDHRTIEDVLSLVRQMQAVVTTGDRLAGLTETEIGTVEVTIRETISRLVRPDEARFPTSLPHLAMARWIQRIDRVHSVEIFTTNYDTLFERALEQLRVPLYDGFAGAFEPFFYPASLRFSTAAPASDWTRLWKVHGSTTWSSKPSPTAGHVIVRGPESASGEMILPSTLKYDESRKQPYVAMLDRFRDVLDKREDGVLVTAGYSFGDQHINDILFDALRHNPRLHLFALTFEELDDSNPLVQLSFAISNILIYGPRTAIVRGQRGDWLPHSEVEVSSRLEGLFDLPPADADGKRVLNGGTLRIGDFVVFSRLLDQIAGSE